MEEKAAGRKTGQLVLIDDVTDEFAHAAGARAWMANWREKMRRRNKRLMEAGLLRDSCPWVPQCDKLCARYLETGSCL